MKKIKITFIAFTLIICAIIVIGMPSQKVQAARVVFPTTNPQTNKDGLGYTINAVTAKYLDLTEIKTGSPVLNETFREAMLNSAIRTSVNSSETYSNSSNSFTNIKASATADLGYSQGATMCDNILDASFKMGFSLEGGLTYKNTLSHYFYNLRFEFVDYTYNLPEYSSNIEYYRQNLHPNFKKALQDVAAGRMKYSDFFDCYGTHMIAKGKYGASLDLYYSVVSNVLDVGGTLKTNIDNEISSKIGDALAANEHIAFNLEVALGESTRNCNSQFTMKSYGGNAFFANSIDSFNQRYDLWYPTIQSNPTLIGTTSDGLIPIWELVPNLKNRTAMQLQYFRYIAEKNNNTEFENNSLTGDEYVYNYYRSAEKKITDEGRFIHGIYDIIKLDEMQYGIRALSQLGFKTVTIEYTAEMKEIDDGYQYIFVYKSTENNDNHLFQTKKFELNGTSKQKDYTTMTFKFDKIYLSELLDTRMLVFRYGASGAFNDDWMNKNVNIKLTFEK